MATAAWTELGDFSDNPNSAQFVFLGPGFGIWDPLWIAVDPRLGGGFADGVGQESSQVSVFVRNTIR